MKSAIRVAYDTLVALVSERDEQVSKFNSRAMPVLTINLAQVIDEVANESKYRHPLELAQNYKSSIEFETARLSEAEKLLATYEQENDDRARSITSLFLMLPKEDQEEILVNKLQN